MNTAERNQAWSALYRASESETRIPQFLKRYCLYHHLSLNDAADAFQYALEISLKDFHKFQGSAAQFRGWLFSIARNYLRVRLHRPTRSYRFYQDHGRVFTKRSEAERIEKETGHRPQFISHQESIQIWTDSDYKEDLPKRESPDRGEFGLSAIESHHSEADLAFRNAALPNVKHAYVKYVSVDPTKPAPTKGRGLILYEVLAPLGRVKSCKLRTIFNLALTQQNHKSTQYKWSEFPFLRLEY